MLQLLDSILAGTPDPRLDSEFPFYPLDSPGIPSPGPSFAALAAHFRPDDPDAALHYLYRRALYDENFSMQVLHEGGLRLAAFVPGHLLGVFPENGSGGPRPADVMVVGKNPGKEEVRRRANFIGPTSQVFFDALAYLGVSERDIASWYSSNLVRWPSLDTKGNKLPDAHKSDCAILWEQELRLVRPKYLLCLGADAAKRIIGPDASIEMMVGRVVTKTIPVHLKGQPPATHTIKCMAITHPAQVHRVPGLTDAFRDQLQLFISLTNGADIGGREKGLRHVNIYTARHLQQVIDEIKSDPDPERRVIAVDGEWEGKDPIEPGAYLRTIQFSSAHKEGFTVVLRHQGGEPAFKPSIDHARDLLLTLFKSNPEQGWFPQIGGHFFRSDLPWLDAFGIDLRDEYAPPDDFGRLRVEGGWETSLGYHAVCETATYNLTHVMARLTQAPVYDGPVNDSIDAYCAEHKIKAAHLEGFGFLPDWVLHPNHHYPGKVDYSYTCYDPDVTRRIRQRLFEPEGLLDRDQFGNPSWQAYWIAHRASLGVLQMERTGLTFDKDRADKQVGIYSSAYDTLLAAFQQEINSPNFNPRSQPNCTAFLFGSEFGKPADPGAVTLNLRPVKTTDKPPLLWDDVVRKGQQKNHSPSTDKETLGILGAQSPLAMRLRDLRFIATTLSGPLRRPLVDKNQVILKDEDGNYIYEEGLATAVLSDGRVHTHISQTKETRRFSTYRPPLQNISKRREADYARILGTFKDGVAKGAYLDVLGSPLYQHPIRSILRAPPGCVLIEADYSGAEVAMMAWLSGDPTMIDHVRRGSLPESDPNYWDMHSRTAVRCFHLDCQPTKSGLAAAGKKTLRDVAKTIVFGIPYGRGPDAVARQCLEEGVQVTVEECQAGVDYYFETYPLAGTFLERVRTRSREERWLCGVLGGRRRFALSRDPAVTKKQEREAQNFLIQNGVADEMNVAIYNFHKFQRQHPEARFLLAMQIHDALLFQVEIPYVRTFVKEVLRQQMIHNVPVWPTNIDGTRMPVHEPFYFNLEFEIYTHWGEPLHKPELTALGIDLTD